jgi:hypothetical protein
MALILEKAELMVVPSEKNCAGATPCGRPHSPPVG